MENKYLASKGMIAVLFAQFLSALADNALLFAAIVQLKHMSAPDWQTPMLQEFFVVAFILLAPFVGPMADAWSKGRVMLIANILKAVGVGMMMQGIHPLWAYGMVGIGAALYSPAKYGILGELVSKDKLIKANGMMEGSTIVAILLGAVAGGYMADHSVNVALQVLMGIYVVACIANMLIPVLPAAHPMERWNLFKLFGEFWVALKTLLSQKDARASLIGTSLFWGTGSTLRFLLVAWIPLALNIQETSMAANLSGVVAIGIAIGAAFASKWIGLHNVHKVMPAGICIGLLIIGFSMITNLYLAIALLIAVGICGGFYVVPLNALLQEKGHETVGAGHAIAVQNFFENGMMLMMIGLYVGMERMEWKATTSAIVFGVFVVIGMLVLWMNFPKKPEEDQSVFY